MNLTGFGLREAQFNHDTCVATTEYGQTDQSEDAIAVESDYVSGCALLAKRDTIEKIGMLDERFFLYWEDVDWGPQMQQGRAQKFNSAGFSYMA